MLVTGKHILLSDAEPDGGTAHAFIVTDPAVVLEKRTRPFLRIVLFGTGGTVYNTSGEALSTGFGANNCRNVIAIYIPK
jgi:hypothetical protein